MYIVVFHYNPRQVSCVMILNKDTCEQIPALFLFGIVTDQVCFIFFRIGHFQILDRDIFGIVNMNRCHILLWSIFIGLPRIPRSIDNGIISLSVPA